MTSETNYQYKTMEIHLNEYLWAVLRHWRSILVVFVSFGIIFAGIGGIREFVRYKDDELRNKLQTEYDEELDKYLVEKNHLEKKLENLKEQLARQEAFEDTSIMLKIDEYDVAERIVTYYIDTDYEIVPELYYQNPNYTAVITNFYRTALNRVNYDLAVASDSEPNLTIRNPVSGNNKKIMNINTDAENGILTIVIYGDNEERVNSLYGLVESEIQKEYKVLNDVIGTHNLLLLSDLSKRDIDVDFGNIQSSYESKTEDILDGIKKTNKQLDELKKPKNNFPTKKSVIVQGIKIGVIGAIGGLFLVIVFWFLYVFLKDFLFVTEDIFRRYKTPVLGTYLLSDQKMTKLDKKILTRLGIAAEKTKEEQIEFISANIRFYNKKQEKIFLVGTASQETLSTITKQLSAEITDHEIIPAGNLNDCGKAIDLIQENGGIIFIEELNRSQHIFIRHELQIVEASPNSVIGFIVVK